MQSCNFVCDGGDMSPPLFHVQSEIFHTLFLCLTGLQKAASSAIWQETRRKPITVSAASSQYTVAGWNVCICNRSAGRTWHSQLFQKQLDINFTVIFQYNHAVSLWRTSSAISSPFIMGAGMWPRILKLGGNI